MRGCAVLYDRAGVMSRLAQDEELCNEVLATFIREVPEYIRELDSAIVARQVLHVRKMAHTIKGSATNVGVVGIAGIAAQLEVVSITEKWEDIDRLSKELGSQFRSLIVQVKEQFGIGV